VEFVDELRAHRNHHPAQDERAEDAPEQDPVLVQGRHPEIAEDHDDHEDVVDAQRLLDNVTGEVLAQRRAAVIGGAVDDVDAEPESEPVGIVGEPDEDPERKPQGDPERRPAEGFLHPDHVRFAVKDAQVQGQHQEHEGDETCPHPDHAARPPVPVRWLLRSCIVNWVQFSRQRHLN